MKYKYILFDMDGTLIDSSPGITRCVADTLKAVSYTHLLGM